jgi:general secretion pathway protein H
MARAPARGKGFTVVELLVVIVIIGLAATAVLLAMPESGGSLASEAERFAARAKAARDGAILESRLFALRIGPEGYAIASRRGGEWQSEARHDWVEGTRVELSGGTGGTIGFDPTGLADPAHIMLARGERRVAIEIGNDGSIQIRR